MYLPTVCTCYVHTVLYCNSSEAIIVAHIEANVIGTANYQTRSRIQLRCNWIPMLKKTRFLGSKHAPWVWSRLQYSTACLFGETIQLASHVITTEASQCEYSSYPY